jgi:hypothetical protein
MNDIELEPIETALIFLQNLGLEVNEAKSYGQKEVALENYESLLNYTIELVTELVVAYNISGENLQKVIEYCEEIRERNHTLNVKQSVLEFKQKRLEAEIQQLEQPKSPWWKKLYK